MRDLPVPLPEAAKRCGSSQDKKRQTGRLGDGVGELNVQHEVGVSGTENQ